MRAALLGLLVSESELAAWNEVACRITHTDPRAIDGALVVATAARGFLSASGVGFSTLGADASWEGAALNTPSSEGSTVGVGGLAATGRVVLFWAGVGALILA